MHFSERELEITTKTLLQLNQIFIEQMKLTSPYVLIPDYLDSWQRITYEFIDSYQRGKIQCRDRIEKFLVFIQRKYYPQLDITPFLAVVYDKISRQVELLKRLHVKKTLDQLAGELSVSAQVISADLGELKNGATILGQKIKIEHEYKHDEYRSTVHPVFLPLNLTEIYALTVGLKKLAEGKGGNIVYQHLADYVYAQLSDYARHIIDQAAQREKVSFATPSEAAGYHKEKTLIDRERDYRLMYAEKSRNGCIVKYEENGVFREAEGWISLDKNHDCLVLQSEKGEMRIELPRVVDITLKEYR